MAYFFLQALDVNNKNLQQINMDQSKYAVHTIIGLTILKKLILVFLAVSFIAEFSFRFCCFVIEVKQLLKVEFIVHHVMTKMSAN